MQWFITFIDDHSRVCWVYLLKDKSNVEQTFKIFHPMIKNQFNTSIIVFRTNNGKKYFNSILGDSITHQSSSTDRPQQNGVIEQKICHLLEVARAVRYAMNVPKYLWGEVVLTVAYLINHMPSKVLNYVSPSNLPSLPIHAIILLKVFGCTSFAHVQPQYRTKHEKSIKCLHWLFTNSTWI